ncbi:signal peptidase II [Paenibacillus contaminans]|uniref:Lipoprotein signal peptidase n=1 Tax=Paenibacillus contaminans TaxID=450362 RepID=A0A329MJJ9_9BACL|nr:signal peptidase II [Paenibacillus contaminans]RAV19822.1 signal peptidase II [Paenibacillus contaminans]
MFYFVIALIVFLLDQGSKWLIVNKMSLYESRPVIGEFFQITSHRNTGAAFSILEGQRWFFLCITVVVVTGIIWYLLKMIKDKRKLLSWALSLLLGGAVGNFLDRALTGEVVDFLQFRFQFSLFGKAIDYTFAIFNLADSAIVIGVSLIFLDAIRSWLQERRGNANESHGS